MTTKSKRTLYKNLPTYKVGDIVTINKHTGLSYNSVMNRWNDLVVTIDRVLLQDATYWGMENEIVKAHNHQPIYTYKFKEGMLGNKNIEFMNEWLWYSYDFEESHEKRKVKLYKK